MPTGSLINKKKEGLKIENRRGFVRFFSNLNVRYFIQADTRGWKECTITNASLTCMGIKFHTYEEIYTGSTLYFVIPVPTELVPVNVRGVLKWINPHPCFPDRFP